MTDPNADPNPIAGVLVIDKPYRLTSSTICNVVKGKLKAGGAPKRIKVGHGGTLDPLATGVLVIMVGRATKLCERVMADRKQYLAEIDLAHTSSTDDLEGELTPVQVDTPPAPELVRAVCDQFEGVIQQTPPIHSAIKVGGKRAFDLARKGADVSLKSRPVKIEGIEIIDYEFPRLTIDVACGKGTYIRSLARDLGVALGTGGTLANLRRTAVGDFRVEDALTLDDLPDPLDPRSLTVPPGLT